MFNVGDSVRLIDGCGGLTVCDRLYSEATKTYSYKLRDGANVYKRFFEEDEIEYDTRSDDDEDDEYSIEATVADNVVICILKNSRGREVRRGHGHIIHAGEVGIAQALSYAASRLYRSYEDDNDTNNYTKKKRRY